MKVVGLVRVGTRTAAFAKTVELFHSGLESRRGDWGGWAHFRAPDGCVYELKATSSPGPSD